MTNQNKLRMCAWLIAGLIWSAASGLTWAQTERGNSAIPNGDLENWSEEQLTAWSFISADGALIKPETEACKQGQYAALIDATQEKIKGNSFSNLMQSIAAEPWRGKKVRLKAWIKTGQLTGAARAQMWLRVDLAATTDKSDETPAAGAFDNMDQRPIRNDEWQQVEIVLPVAETADRLALGVFLIGQGQVWVDDVSLEAVPDDTPSTSSQTVSSEPRFQLPPVVMKAFQEADKAPQQPFFTPWLWVALLAMAIFFVAMFGPVPRRREAVDMDSGVVPQSLLRKFCMHVTVCYWLLYCLPSAVGTLAGLGIGFLGTVAGWIEQGNAMIAQGLAARLFGIEGELVPPNGSGDTTYNYLLVLGLFAISLIVGTLWTLLDRRATDQSNMRDFLRIVLRYTIALAMIGYGLAKFGWEGNQFPPNSSFQLDKTWGDSSPMNVLWAFMGASQAYTMFAGLGEIIAGLLIVWRRTTLIGAAAAFGVMLNVMMLNFCYDVPVKLYSTHLVVMAIMVMLPDAVRLANLFVLNRVVEPADLRGIWQAPWAWWTHWVLKVVVVGYFVLWPVATRIADLPSQWQAYVAEQKSEDMEKYLLNKRGYRWINEVPFNR